MQGATHRFGGMALGAVVSFLIVKTGNIHENGIIYSSVIMAGSAVGSLIPDIDHEGSLIGKKIKPLAKAIRRTFGHRGLTHTILALFIYGLIAMIISKSMMNIIKTNSSPIATLIMSLVFALVCSVSITFILDELPLSLRKRSLRKIGLWTIVISTLSFLLFTKYLVSYIAVYMWGTIIGYASHLLLDMLTVTGVPLFYPFITKNFRLMKLKTGHSEGQVSLVCITIIIFFISLLLMI